MKGNARRQFMAGASALVGSALVPAVAESQDQSVRRVRGIEGETAPELELDYWIDANGDPSSFSVKDSKGKWVFLKCFQNWCPGCHKTGFPALKAFADKFHGHPEVAIAGIQTVFEGYNSNTIEDVRKLQLQYELPVVMGHDEGDPNTYELPSTMRNYRTGGTPWMILIAPDGRVVFNDFQVNPKLLIEYVGKYVA